MEAEALIRRVFLRLVAEISDRFLEQLIDNKFHAELGSNAGDTCAMLWNFKSL
jgi:hypothetical protein